MDLQKVYKMISKITHKKDYEKVSMLISHIEKNNFFKEEVIKEIKLKLEEQIKDKNFKKTNFKQTRNGIAKKIEPYKDEIKSLWSRGYNTYSIYNILKEKYGEEFTKNAGIPYSFDRAAIKITKNKGIIGERRSKYQIYEKECKKMLKSGETKYKIWKTLSEKYGEMSQTGFYKFLRLLESQN